MKERIPSVSDRSALVPFGFCMAPFLHFHSAARCLGEGGGRHADVSGLLN